PFLFLINEEKGSMVPVPQLMVEQLVLWLSEVHLQRGLLLVHPVCRE
nr:hypothetical protein [Tanacetum cinerariifolium]